MYIIKNLNFLCENDKENECGAFRTVALKNLHKFLISERGQWYLYIIIFLNIIYKILIWSGTITFFDNITIKNI